MPPHRIVGKHNDMALADGHVDHGGTVGKLASTCEHSARQQIAFSGKSENNSW